jgi:hypothetical protein
MVRMVIVGVLVFRGSSPIQERVVANKCYLGTVDLDTQIHLYIQTIPMKQSASLGLAEPVGTVELEAWDKRVVASRFHGIPQPTDPMERQGRRDV